MCPLNAANSTKYNFKLFTTYKMFRTTVVPNNLEECILSFCVIIGRIIQ